jgi:hypothetical protein
MSPKPSPRKPSPRSPLALLGLCLPLLASSLGCSSTETADRSYLLPEQGDWRIGASTQALATGSYLDQSKVTETAYDLDISAAWLASRNLALELAVEGASERRKDDAKTFDDFAVNGKALAGLRVYFLTKYRTWPYLSFRFGASHTRLEDKLASTKTTQTNPMLQLRLGGETFLTKHVAIDYGLLAENIFDVETSPTVSENRVSGGAYFGFSVWF